MSCDSREKSVGNVLSMNTLQVIRNGVFYRLNSIQFLVRNVVFDLVFLDDLATKVLWFE